MTEADAAAGGGKSRSTEKPPLSKRQRRKNVNPSNTWPQQPKIQSPAARAKANLRVAGLLGNSSNAASSLDPELDLHSPEIRFGRHLAASEQRTRHYAVTSLQNHLKLRCDTHSSHGISELDLLKLWKGLWFTLYLADKVPVQEELSKRLAKLLWCVAGTEEEDEYAAQMYLDMCNQQEDEVVMEEVINTLDQDDEEKFDMDEQEDSSDESSSSDGDGGEVGEKDQKESSESDETSSSGDESNEQAQKEEEEIPDELIQHCRGAHLAALFVKTFFRTIQREWGKMDKHRIDKFYTLVRLMLREIFSYMAARHWNRGIIFLFNDVIREEVLFQVPNGLRCHLIDICLAELAKVNTEAPMPLTEATFLDFLDPYFALAQNSDDVMVHGRVIENIFGKFLDEYSVVNEKEDADEVLDQVHVGTVAEFLFNLGSDMDTQERYRKPLYDMYKKYMKRLKKVGKDVDLSMESSDGIDDTMKAEEKSEEGEVRSNKRKRKDTEEVEGDNRYAHNSSSKADRQKPHKNKRKKAKQKAELQKESVLEWTPVEEVADEPNEKKRSNKKKKHEYDSHTETVLDETLEEEVSIEEQSADKKRSKKKRKKKRKSSVSSDDGSKSGMKEEVITITYSDQKKAANDIAKQGGTFPSSPKKKTSKKGATTPETTRKSIELTSEEKRVKWGFRNYSKSYKASMKALQTVKHTPNKTPERGILRMGSSKKKSRKRATDYF